MWETVLNRFLIQFVTKGTLIVTYPGGRTARYGPGGEMTAGIEITTVAAARALSLNPILALGETYMDGSLIVTKGSLHDLLTLLGSNYHDGELPFLLRTLQWIRRSIRRFTQQNNALKSRKNVAHHYDISDDFYRLFLDEDMQYSCAYFTRPDMTLEDAQSAKKAHIAAKLQIEPGMRVLDIGCGWGGMALTLARDHGAKVTGVTLSKNQYATARARAETEGLSELCDFQMLDYRKVSDRYDRVVSVGMLEHVGLPHYDEYFGKIFDILEDDGIALVHTIGRTTPPFPTSPWIDKYIFPGGYVPSLSDLAPALERSGLWSADLEVLRGHYGRTLNHWRQRFEANLDAVRGMYDDRFIRMWRFYLVACEMAFEKQHQIVFQFQLSRAQHVVPATRNYLYAAEARSLSHAAE